MTKTRDFKLATRGIAFRPVQTGGVTRTVVTIKCAHPGCIEQHETMQSSRNHPTEFLIKTVTRHGWTHTRGNYFCPAHKD